MVMPKKEHSLRLDNSRLYSIWAGMKGRCHNPNSKAYYHYGNRGITYDEMWEKFENFYNDLQESYYKHVEEFGEKDTSIDRINVDGNYELDNVRWATILQQSYNKRNFKHSTPYRGISYRKAEKAYEIDFGSMHVGWSKSLEEAIKYRIEAEKKYLGESPLEKDLANGNIQHERDDTNIRNLDCNTKDSDGIPFRIKYKKLYSQYNGIKTSCYNNNDYAYKYNGAIGIVLCDEWNTFYKFLSWALDNGYMEGKYIARKNTEDNFTPNNCYIADKRQSVISSVRFGISNKSEYYVELKMIYNSMINKCYKEENKMYAKFGALGIRVCARWKDSFKNFYVDMIDIYKDSKGKKLMFSRYDFSKDFTPDNCGMVKHGYKG